MYLLNEQYKRREASSDTKQTKTEVPLKRLTAPKFLSNSFMPTKACPHPNCPHPNRLRWHWEGCLIIDQLVKEDQNDCFGRRTGTANRPLSSEPLKTRRICDLHNRAVGQSTPNQYCHAGSITSRLCIDVMYECLTYLGSCNLGPMDEWNFM